MAMGMKQWLGASGIGLALVAAWALPPSHLGPEASTCVSCAVRPQVLPEVREYMRLDREVRRHTGVLLATRWADSLAALTVRTAIDGAAAGAPLDNVSPEAFTEWTEDIREYSRSLQPRDDRMVLGFYYQHGLHGLPEGLPAPASALDGMYTGVVDGAPYCMIVNPTDEVTDRNLTYGFSLGACRLYARYGQPSPSIEKWLADGGARFGIYDVQRDELPWYQVTRSWLDEVVDAPVFGLMRHPMVDDYPTGGRCMAGDPQACAMLISEPNAFSVRNVSDAAYVVDNSPLMYTSRASSAYRFANTDGLLLADLEREFGAEAFARFWTSDEALPEAFEDAFGTELGLWVRDWIQSEVGVHRAGPGLQPGTPLLSLLTIMALAAFVSLRGGRRQVG